MFMGIEATVAELECELREATEKARRAMQGLPVGAKRRAHLKTWERALDTAIRPGYKSASVALSRVDHLARDVKEGLKRRLDAVLVTMASDRDMLEGLVTGATPPAPKAPRQPDAAALEHANGLLQKALAALNAEAGRTVKGELLAGWVDRCGGPLGRALGNIKAVLDSQGQSAFFEPLRQEAMQAQNMAMQARDRSADKTHIEILRTLRADLLGLLDEVSKVDEPATAQSVAEACTGRANQALEKARTQLESASIHASLEAERRSFERELAARVGDVTGRWKSPPIFEILSRDRLDPRVKTGAADGDGVYVTFHGNGSLREARTIRDGQPYEHLKVHDRKPQARFEDAANVAEFQPDGTLWEFGGRYERETRARTSFADWVIGRVADMVEDSCRWTELKKGRLEVGQSSP
jgi:hypothetical protein